jgi:hypothetical protein
LEYHVTYISFWPWSVLLLLLPNLILLSLFPASVKFIDLFEGL